MPETLITGGTGFVGQRLVAALAAGGRPRPKLLVRDPARLPASLQQHASIVQGDLSDYTSLRSAVAGCDTIVHLGARTGRADRSEMMDINAAGTRRLAEAAHEAGVPRMVFVSSIAAGFVDRRWYHYAEAKRAAEATVRQSPLDWVIVRPTMVFGPGSPVQAALSRLASAPIGIVFGPGEIPVQPIHANDLVAILAALLERRPLGRELIEAGGPEVISLRELLQRMRRASRGQSGPFVRVPITPLRGLLGLLDRSCGRRLPVTAGQLASFVNPGIATPLPDFLPAPRHGIDEMLSGAAA